MASRGERESVHMVPAYGVERVFKVYLHEDFTVNGGKRFFPDRMDCSLDT